MEEGVLESLHLHIRTLAGGALLALAALAAPARAADVDLTAGVLAYSDPAMVANALTISLAGGTYTIDDPAEVAITLSSNALGQGCEPFDSNTVTCPATAVTSFSISTRLGNDFIVLSGAAHPATVTPGDGDDTVIGGTVDDTFVWNPGDDNDTLDGGPGSDTLAFNGAIVSEIIAITADGTGFDLLRNIANVHMEVENAEVLLLNTSGGGDLIETTGLVATTQVLATNGDASPDTLTFDAAGFCAFQQVDSIDVLGLQPVQFTGFASVVVNNQGCGAIVDLGGGLLSYVATAVVANVLDISLAGDTYTIHDPGEASVDVTRAAFEEGCVKAAASTVTCPAAAITSFSILTRNDNDVISLAGAAHPAIVNAGDGNDTFLGGTADDIFVWSPGDDNDTVDGGPGTDTLRFNGSIISEIFSIVADGAGFDLFRNIANIQMEIENAEVLELNTLGGDDEVSTTSLLHTTQILTTASTDPAPDTLRVDAAGLCLARQGDSFEAEGRQPIHFTNFPEVFVSNAFCRIDPCDGAVPTLGCTINGVRNQPCQGTPGDDVIVGTLAGDVIRGGAGDDRIRGGSGSDVLCGEEDDDRLIGGSGDDMLVGGPGLDRLQDGAGADTLLGGDDADDLKGGSGNDDLDGGAGDDRLRAAGGVDTLRGGPGADRLDGGGDIDTCTDADQPPPFARCELP